MILTFQILLMIIIGISFLGAVAEKDNENLRSSMTGLCIASILAFVVMTLLS